jgi:hypothetical protein
MLLGPPASRPEASPPPSPAPQLAANGLPVLPILDRVA